MTVIQTSKNKALQAQVCVRSTWVTAGSPGAKAHPFHWHPCHGQAKKPPHPALLQLLLPPPLISPSTLQFFLKSLCLGFSGAAVSFETQSWKIITQCCWSCLSITKVTGCRHRHSAGHQAERHYFRCFRENLIAHNLAIGSTAQQTRLYLEPWLLVCPTALALNGKNSVLFHPWRVTSALIH